MSAQNARQVQRRVGRACDYCRQKRLKCTADRRPCYNCQLYNAECTTSNRVPRAAARATCGEVLNDTPHVSTPLPPVGLRSHTDQTEIEQSHDTQQSTDIRFDPAVDVRSGLNDTSSTRDDQSGSCWLFQPEIPPLGFTSADGNQDLNTDLRQLGIGFSSDFWDWDRTALNYFGDVEGIVAGSPAIDHRPSVSQPYTNDTSFTRPPASPQYQLSIRSAANSVNGRVSNINALTQGSDHAVRLQESVPPGIFIRKNETVSNYIGFSSVGATLALCLKDALESQHTPLTAGSLAFLIEAGSHVDDFGISALLDPTSQSLPPWEIAHECVNAYFGDFNRFYAILDEKIFRACVDTIYGNDRSRLSVVDYCIFYLVVSIGALGSRKSPEQADTFSRLTVDAHHKAWSMIHDTLASPCEANVQALLLHVAHQLYFGRSGIAWVFCGLAIRIAQSLGMHRQSPSEMDISESQRRLHFRLWWLAVQFDASLSLSQGRPPAIEAGQCEFEIMSLDTFGNMDGTIQQIEDRGLSQLEVWSCQLLSIQNRFCSLMHSKTTTAARLEMLAKIDHDLVTWRDHLPHEWRPDNVIIASSEQYPYIFLLHLDYFNLVRALHWTVTTLESASSGHLDKLTSRFRASETLCLSAARSFIKTLNDGMNDRFERQAFLRSFHATNYIPAMAVLYRSICKNPSDLSTRADLEHLRAAKVHLERDSTANIHCPSLMALFDNMLSSADILIRQEAT